MCELRRPAAVSVVLVLTTVAAVATRGTLPAQEAPDVAEVRDRIDAVAAEWREAERRRRRADSLRELEREARRRRLDTVRVGPLTVLTGTDHVAEAREFFDRAWEGVAPMVGATASRLEPYRFVYRADEVDYGWDADTIVEVGLGRWSTPARLRRRARTAVGAALTRELPDVLRRWIGGVSLGSEVSWPSVYRDLATASSRVARRCFERGRDCWAALGLEDRAHGWEAWYTPAERRRLILQDASTRRWEPETNAALQGCLDAELAACDRFVRLRGRSAPVPLSVEGRTSVVAFALERGGEGAFARLLDGGGGIPERLAGAAGTSPDALVRAWRAEVRSHSPRVHADLSRTRWSVLAWVLVFAALALRSSRWRLE